MVKPCKKSDSSICPDGFFKVFLPDHSSQRMKLPPAFQKHFNGTVPFKSTIITRMKRSWKVDLEKVGDDLCINKGWEQFVRHYSLEFGDFLVFVYGSNATFHVKIYGRNGCEKESTYPTGVHSGELPLSNHKQLLVVKDDPEWLEDESAEEDFEKDSKALREASKFKSDFPFFKLHMQPSYVKRGSLNIPKSFVKRHMIRDTQGATLVYLNKSFWVNMSASRRKSKLKINGGALTFVRDTAVKEGDVCMFELVDTSDHDTFKVSIFRCSD